jgi:hypothetical protein
VRRAPSADLQATGGLGFKPPLLELQNACTTKVASRMRANLSYREAKSQFDSVDRAPLASNWPPLSPAAPGNFSRHLSAAGEQHDTGPSLTEAAHDL